MAEATSTQAPGMPGALVDAAGRPRIAIVAIGRNEGERLMRCLDALEGLPVPVVYVDSGSGDGSAERARARGVAVHELAADRPFTAARARNEGADTVAAAAGVIPYLQFVDGDCTLVAGWLEAAVAHFDAHPNCAAVTGHLGERDAARNVFHRLCEMEWRGPAGDIVNGDGFGGISAVRTAVFDAIGRFDVSMIAGEDPEMASRLSRAGHTVTKLDRPMALHDAGIDHFGQYWRRAVRYGHSLGLRMARDGGSSSRDSKRGAKSVVVWGFAAPVTMIGLAPVTRGVSWYVLVGTYAALAGRVARYRHSLGDSWRDSALYAGANLLTKFAAFVGLASFYRRRRSAPALVEYK